MEREEIVNIDLPQWELLPDIGLYMDQVITLMDRTFSPALPKGEMTKSMVNNYVKVGLIPRPAGKKYDREHLAMLLMICVLKQALSMESISQILLALCEEGCRRDTADSARSRGKLRSLRAADTSSCLTNRLTRRKWRCVPA